MKTAIKILVIIACIVGIIWSLVGIFGGAVLQGTRAAFEEAQEAEKIKESYVNTSLRHIGSFFAIIIGLIFGIVATGRKTKKIAIIIDGILLSFCGILATMWLSYFAGPIYVLCGILLIIMGIFSKTIKE